MAQITLTLTKQVVWPWIVFALLVCCSEVRVQPSGTNTVKETAGNSRHHGSESGDRHDTPPPKVEAVYPTSDKLPENLLRFYVYFSEPMRQSQNPFEHIHLLDAAGKVVEGAFIENRFDLWSPCGTRLTVLFDPGRVKTGLVAHETMGRALKAGREYQLVVGENLLTADGNRLAEKHQKTFRTIPASMDPKQLNKWEIATPSSATRETLKIHLDGAFDHVSLAYRIRIKDQVGAMVRGRIEVGECETTWLFAPSQNWAPGVYKVVIDARLEDICGNRIGESLDHPIEENAQRSESFFVLSFEIAAARTSKPIGKNLSAPKLEFGNLR